MEKGASNHLEEFVEIALRSGAKAARIIPSEMVAIDERVRLKCEVPRCSGYGQYLTCPPYVMAAEGFRRILSRFKWCLLVQVEAKGLDSTDKGTGSIDPSLLARHRDHHRPFKLKLLEVIEAVEGAAFKKGMRFATGFVGGSCALCERCVEDKMSDACRYPFRARPAMEGVGIDVFETAQNAGLPIEFSSSANVLWTGLVLLD